MEDTDLKWRAASYSSNGGGECIEVADRESRVLVRDTKDRTGPILRFSDDAWKAFAKQVKGSLAADSLQEGATLNTGWLPLLSAGSNPLVQSIGPGLLPSAFVLFRLAPGQVPARGRPHHRRQRRAPVPHLRAVGRDPRHPRGRPGHRMTREPVWCPANLAPGSPG
jgi:hypothetical protein